MFAMLMGLKSIYCQQLHQRMQEGPVTVVDVNARQSWLRARVPGALNLALEFDPSDLPAPLVFYCSNPFCRKAPHAARRAVRLGYCDAHVLSAGIAGWTGADLPFEAGA